MAWGTPTSRGTLSNTAAPTSGPVTSVTVAQNSLIVVVGGLALNSPTITCSDSAGNTYTVVKQTDTAPNPDISAFMAYATAATALSAGTVTVAWGGGAAGSVVCEVFEVTGAATSGFNDSAVTAQQNASGTSPSTTSGTPGESGELFFAVDITDSTSATWTEDTGNGWTTARAKTLSVSAPSMCIGASYLVNSGVGTKTWAPTTAADEHCIILLGFKVLNTGAAAQTLAALTNAGAGALALTGSAAQTLSALTQSSVIAKRIRPKRGGLDAASDLRRFRYAWAVRGF